MPLIDKIKMIKSGPSLSSINPKLAVDIYPVNPSTVPQ